MGEEGSLVGSFGALLVVRYEYVDFLQGATRIFDRQAAVLLPLLRTPHYEARRSSGATRNKYHWPLQLQDPAHKDIIIHQKPLSYRSRWFT